MRTDGMIRMRYRDGNVETIYVGPYVSGDEEIFKQIGATVVNDVQLLNIMVNTEKVFAMCLLKKKWTLTAKMRLDPKTNVWSFI